MLSFGFLALTMSVSGAAPRSFDELLNTMRNFQESRVLLAAVELDLFTALGEGATAGEVAARLKADRRATEMLLNALVAVGALAKSGGVFQNTPDTARYLTAGSPENQRPALMHTVHVWKAWTTLTECVRRGTAVLPPGVEAHDEQWTQAFIAAMHRNAMSAAPALVEAVGAAGVRRLLDVGGGSGAYSIAFARANPELRAEVLDLAAVVPIAQKHIAEAGLEGRVTARVGDLLKDDFGEGYDLILLSAICHMLGPEENQELLARCRRALAPGGRLVIRDFILDPDKTSPKAAALFALNMLVNTRAGATYSEAEYGAWLAGAGFASVTRLGPDLIVARRP
jgi:SAM-dependent methyltransferase